MEKMILGIQRSLWGYRDGLGDTEMVSRIQR